MHGAAIMKKHAAQSLLETKAQRSSHQTTRRSSIKRQPALKRSALMYVFAFLLPVSKNSDRRFKFFRDMDSDSTWETENRFQRATLKSNKNTYIKSKQFFSYHREEDVLNTHGMRAVIAKKHITTLNFNLEGCYVVLFSWYFFLNSPDRVMETIFTAFLIVRFARYLCSSC